MIFLCRVDNDSPLYADLQQLKEKEGKDHLLLNMTFEVSILCLFVFNQERLTVFNSPVWNYNRAVYCATIYGTCF